MGSFHPDYHLVSVARGTAAALFVTTHFSEDVDSSSRAVRNLRSTPRKSCRRRVGDKGKGNTEILGILSFPGLRGFRCGQRVLLLAGMRDTADREAAQQTSNLSFEADL